jgi:hypothetical protein
MVTLKQQHAARASGLGSRICIRLGRCEAASLAMLEADLAVEEDVLLSKLEDFVAGGRVEALDPVRGATGCGTPVRFRESRFYRLRREEDAQYEWEQAVDTMPLNVLARRLHDAWNRRSPHERRSA